MGYSGVLLACLDERDPWLSHVIYHTTVWARLASATTPSVALDLPRSTTSGLCRPKARTKFEHTYRPIAHMWRCGVRGLSLLVSFGSVLCVAQRFCIPYTSFK